MREVASSRMTMRSCQRSSQNHWCWLASMWMSMPGSGRRGRRLRCAPRALEHTLRPGIAETEAVLARQLLVEVADVEVEVLLPIEPQDFIEHRRGHAPRARLAASAVEEGVEAEPLILLLPAPHVAGAHA